METALSTYSLATDLYCPACGKAYAAEHLQTYATCCNQPLVMHYAPVPLSRSLLNGRPHNMWRYHELLPLRNKQHIVSLGEGWTPLYSLAGLADRLGIKKILLKDESVNPTGSFKARGISVAVSRAKELGITHCIMPTAGNAGGALSAYAAKAQLKATIIMPAHTPKALKDECRYYGAELLLVDGLIDACAQKAKALCAQTGAFDLSTLKEPYRLEGKKTLGYEIAEQLQWHLPDVIVYPTGGGTGLIGMWKAFHEMMQFGWIHGRLPRMVVVQSVNCAPMVQVFETGALSPHFSPKATSAYGLAVPYPFAKDMILQTLQDSGGTAIAVSEAAIESSTRELACEEGRLLSPEGAAAYAGLKKLVEKDYIRDDETVLFFNTGSWYKYR